MKEIKAPGFVSDKVATIFLAGSIEMGAAERWQDKAVSYLSQSGFTVLNPRRDDWDSSWEQSMNDPRFVEQVQWELQGIEGAEYIIMYFDPETKAPITLLELGLIAGSAADKLLVVCPKGFYRKGNVDVVCDRYRVRQFDSLEAACNHAMRQAEF